MRKHFPPADLEASVNILAMHMTWIRNIWALIILMHLCSKFVPSRDLWRQKAGGKKCLTNWLNNEQNKSEAITAPKLPYCFLSWSCFLGLPSFLDLVTHKVFHPHCSTASNKLQWSKNTWVAKNILLHGFTLLWSRVQNLKIFFFFFF